MKKDKENFNISIFKFLKSKECQIFSFFAQKFVFPCQVHTFLDTKLRTRRSFFSKNQVIALHTYFRGSE